MPATPLGPAGGIRATVIETGEAKVLGDGARRLSRLGALPFTDNTKDSNGGTRTWRYRFNVLGDLIAVRDPRGCGQNFFYDRGGRLLGEQYVACDEAPTTIDQAPDASVEGAVFEVTGSGGGGSVSALVDVGYSYDDYPAWFIGTVPAAAAGTVGRATGVEDRGQRSVVAYDERGNAIWTARQLAIIPSASGLTTTPGSGDYPDVNETAPYAASVSYDSTHLYEQSSEYDYANRGRRLTLPRDPDFGSPGTPGPAIVGELRLDPRGLPIGASAFIDSEEIPVLSLVEYDEHGVATGREYGPEGSPVLTEEFVYDHRLRPVEHRALRGSTAGTSVGEIGYVTAVASETLSWDDASNLVGIDDQRDPLEWPVTHRTRNTTIVHDSLYRVMGVTYDYRQPGGSTSVDTSSDWRSEAAPINTNDPMHPAPASLVGSLPSTRVMDLDYEWDWLGNEVMRLDDAWSFYERSLGTLTSGNDPSAGGGRPSALYLSTNIDDVGGVESTWDGAGWVELQYGASGNVTSFTVHGQCHDVSTGSCVDDPTDDVSTRREALRSGCTCAEEQHYSYRWDELNRLVDGRRYDRTSATAGAWTPGARLRYRYDAANQRTVKERLAMPTSGGGLGGLGGIGGTGGGGWTTSERVTLFVYPGDYERRGVTRGFGTYDAVTTGTDATETQYLVAGARLVWDASGDCLLPPIDRNRRATINVTDLLGTTGAVVDLLSADLVEVSTYYPNGARENLWTNDALVPIEPMGFTTKEADEELGVTHFGERWLISRLGRWATPDPLHVHAAGGGEALNSYHYVSGNLLQATDPTGLDWWFEITSPGNHAAHAPTQVTIHLDYIVADSRPETIVSIKDYLGRELHLIEEMSGAIGTAGGRLYQFTFETSLRIVPPEMADAFTASPDGEPLYPGEESYERNASRLIDGMNHSANAVVASEDFTQRRGTTSITTHNRSHSNLGNVMCLDLERDSSQLSASVVGRHSGGHETGINWDFATAIEQLPAELSSRKATRRTSWARVRMLQGFRTRKRTFWLRVLWRHGALKTA